MTPPKIDRGDHLTAMHAYGYKKCRCGRPKVRDLEAICKDCFAKLPEAMQRGLKECDAQETEAVKSVRRL